MYSSIINWGRLSTNSRYGQRSLTAASVVLSTHRNDFTTTFYGFSAESSMLWIICCLLSKGKKLSAAPLFAVDHHSGWMHMFWFGTHFNARCTSWQSPPIHLCLVTNTRSTLAGDPLKLTGFSFEAAFVPPPSLELLHHGVSLFSKCQKNEICFFHLLISQLFISLPKEDEAKHDSQTR